MGVVIDLVQFFFFFFFLHNSPSVRHGLFFHEVSRLHTKMHHSR